MSLTVTGAFVPHDTLGLIRDASQAEILMEQTGYGLKIYEHASFLFSLFLKFSGALFCFQL